MENPELQKAWDIISYTDTHLFLTGKAGTGKTTFLHKLRESIPKRMVVVAPTGIAAINAKGTTIHSFFQLGFGPQIPGTQQKNKRFQFRKQKIRLIRSLDLIVIDEISMVRADVLDAIDSILRQYRNSQRPFGGIQMLMIGDMQQLAPVAKEEEWNILSSYYSTPYFFSSRALQNTDFVTIELKHVYRQSDPFFIGLLNAVRENTADDSVLQQLNKRYIPGFSPNDNEGYIRLTTHNYQADNINKQKLAALTTRAYDYNAAVEGDFPDISYPTDETLTLKEGAQVMFIKNDSSPEKRYYNGLIAKVISLDTQKIIVKTINEGQTIEVGHEKWENIKYAINDKTQEIQEETVGTFSQFPLKTAWAITVHKSQGLTFEHAIIDVQHSFAHGQTYVALSRCKTLEGMVLSNPIPRNAIINDSIVQQFCNDQRHQEPDKQHLDLMERKYMLRITEELFHFYKIHYPIDDLIKLMREFFYSSHPKLYTSWLGVSDKLKQPEVIANRFHTQYQNLIMIGDGFKGNDLLQERLKKGAKYFKDELGFINNQLAITKLVTNNKQVKERLNNILQTLNSEYRLKMLLLDYVADNGINIQEYLQFKAKSILKIDNGENTNSRKYSKKNIK